MPTFTFRPPITRLSRSPTPMGRKPTVVAPGRKFVPQKSVNAISSSSEDEDPVFLGRTSIIGTRSFANTPSSSASRSSLATPARYEIRDKNVFMHRSSAFGSNAFGANRQSTFGRSSMAPRSRNPTLVDSDDELPTGRASFMPRTSTAGRNSTATRPSMGRSITDTGDNSTGFGRFRRN